ncbi:carbohydrate ABC transporter permease [Breznakiella homolactica]|uniref:Sugar ABC transporter permease n=1 Tax=Breznakiella homolactica TaxID=2798577 RepID=A0A7T8BC03_9SPIR|nr:sugar ABC transporter permease [Breznakiella homolactica]QQO10625.1 sugar ABC transporter permease [Breznakiella homolactica]
MVQTRKLSSGIYKRIYPYFWFTPLILILGFTILYPWIWSLGLSFTKWNLSEGDTPVFIGLRNYINVLTEPLFLLSLRQTALFMVITVPAQLLIGFGTALLLNQNVKGRGLFLSCIMLPFMLTPSIVGLIWKILLSGQWGVFNYFLSLVGIYNVGWLSNPDLSMLTISIIDVWQHAPWVMLVLFAGLQAIPKEMYEAAEIDGAGYWQSFRYVTIPFLSNLIGIVVLFRLMFALRSFDVIYTLFRSGGPANAAMVLGVYLYEQFRLTWEIGKSSATSYIILILTLLFSVPLIIRMYREKKEKI